MKDKKVKSVAQAWKDMNDKIEKNQKCAFLYTVIITFLCHLSFFVDRFANEDYMHDIFTEVNMLASGRWMPGNIFSSNMILPMVLFVITMISLGLISVMINNLLKINNRIYIFIISALLATFPTLALGFGYTFMIERYVLGMFLAVFSVFVTDKYKYGFILGAITLAITLGYYQSYIAIAVSLVILKIIVKCLENKKTKEILISILKFLIMGITGAVLYLILVKVINNYFSVELLSYKGIDKMGSLPPLNQFGELLTRTYESFKQFFLSKQFWIPMWYGRIAQIVLYFSNIILLVFAVIKNKLYRNIPNMIIFIIMLCLIPLGFNIVDFLAFESQASSLNIYQFVFVFIIPFIIMSNLQFKIKESNKVSSLINVGEWICVIASIVLIWNNFVVSNIYYLKINDYYNSTVLLTNRIFSQIEKMPGFDSDTKVMIGNKKGIYIGREPYRTYNDVFLTDQGLWRQFIGYYPHPIGNDLKQRRLVDGILGIHLIPLEQEEYDKIYNSKEYDKMKSWPDEKCMKYIDGVLVVKLS